MPVALAQSKSPPDSSKKTRIGGDDEDADLERLLPHDPESGGDHPTPSPTSSTTAGVITGRLEEMGTEEQRKHEGRTGDGWARTLALAGATVLVVLTWSIVIFNNPTTFGWFAFHPLLQTLALASFTYGILTLQPTSQPASKAAGLLRHQTAVFVIGFPIIILGTLSVMYNKWLREADHFKSWHGTLGFICILWLLVQIFIGAGSVLNGGALFGGGMKAKRLWKYHRMSGYILFPLMMFTAHLGGSWSGWAETYASGLIGFVTYTVAPALILTGVYVRVRLSKMKFW